MDNEIKHKKAKKKLLIFFSVFFLIFILLIIASFAIDKFEQKGSDTENINFKFYPADFEENIFENTEYVELTKNGFISYTDSKTNITLGISRENAAQHGSNVEFIVETLYDIIHGDHEGYNSRFSQRYFSSNEPKQTFTMQKIYDVNITFVSTDKIQDEQGDNYTKSIYILEYKILENNGTFRKDIGEGSKKQYITISDLSGELLIDSITTVNY